MRSDLPRPAQPNELVGIDCEMFAMERPHRADGTFACLSIAYVTGEVYQIYDPADIAPTLERLEAGVWCLQNALFDLRVLRRFAPVKRRYIHDSMLVEQDLFGGWFSRFSLDNLARRWLGIVLNKEVRERFGKAIEMTPEMKEYAARDALVTVQIAEKQREYVEKELGGNFKWYTEIDEPALWAILDMQPIRVDVDGWLKNAETLKVDAARMEEELGFNVYSHKTVKEKLEAMLGHPLRGTNANDVLLPLAAKLGDDHKATKLIRRVLEIRKLRKAAETYGETWVEQYVESDMCVYPSWGVTGTATGRMSCSEPNVQNIPVRDNPIYRRFFVASPGHVLQIADAEQQEPWFSAVLSQDPVLLKELQDGSDLHQITADLFGVSRTRGKAINLGLNYGMTEFGLADQVGLSREAAQAGIRARERRYRRMAIWRDDMVKQGRMECRVRTASGRPVWLNPYMDGWERIAYNAPAQGSGGDHLKAALAINNRLCAEAGVPFRVTMAVHDEVVQDVPIEQAALYRDILVNSWLEAGELLAPGMPIRYKVVEGLDWGNKT